MPQDSVNEYTIQRVQNALENVDGDQGERLVPPYIVSPPLLDDVAGNICQTPPADPAPPASRGRTRCLGCGPPWYRAGQTMLATS